MIEGLRDQPLLVATHNQGKLQEMRELFAPHGVRVASAADFGLDEPAETEDTFVGNARIKAHNAAQKTGSVALADDSGLCVDALNGAPGVYTADWAEGPNGRDFTWAMEKTHAALVKTGAAEPWTAAFHCVLVLAWPDGRDKVFEGVAKGRVVWPTQGAHGHGYDPMFIPEGANRTFAQMSANEKNALSHRSDALAKLIAACFP